MKEHIEITENIDLLLCYALGGDSARSLWRHEGSEGNLMKQQEFTPRAMEARPEPIPSLAQSPLVKRASIRNSADARSPRALDCHPSDPISTKRHRFFVWYRPEEQAPSHAHIRHPR
jgi:hypothetical protein